MTTGFLTSFERRYVVAETVDVVQRGCGQEAVDLRKVTEGRTRERVSRIDCPRELAGVERNSNVVLDWLMERLGRVKVFTFLWVESSEEPELVFHNRATDVTTDVSF